MLSMTRSSRICKFVWLPILSSPEVLATTNKHSPSAMQSESESSFSSTFPSTRNSSKRFYHQKFTKTIKSRVKFSGNSIFGSILWRVLSLFFFGSRFFRKSDPHRLLLQSITPQKWSLPSAESPMNHHAESKTKSRSYAGVKYTFKRKIIFAYENRWLINN